MLNLDLSKIDPSKVFRDAEPINIKTAVLTNLQVGLPESQEINAKTERKFDQALVTLNGKRICSVGNGLLIIAPQGTGKSNVCEALAAATVIVGYESKSLVDTLGFQFHPLDGIGIDKGVLYADTERSTNDVSRGFDRIVKRTGVDVNIEGSLPNLTLLSMTYSMDSKRSRDIIEEYVKKENYSLVIIDGIADFVLSENDLEEAKSLIKWLIVLSARYSFGWVVTMHPNPDQAQGKAMGHLGTFLGKKCEAVLNMFKHEHEKDVRIITTEYNAGKVRNDSSEIYQEIYYNKEQNMFLSVTDRKSEKTSLWKEALVSRKHIEKEEFERFIYYNHFNGSKSLSVCKKFVSELLELGEIILSSGRIKLPDPDQMIDPDENETLIRYLDPPEDDTSGKYRPSKFMTGGDEELQEEEPF